MFGLSEELSTDEASALHDVLIRVLQGQFERVSGIEIAPETWTEIDLRAMLISLRRWFNPISSGRKLRDELANLPTIRVDLQSSWSQLFVTAGRDRLLVTPEGVVVLWLLKSDAVHLSRGFHVQLRGNRNTELGLLTLASVYKSWNEQRLRGVTDLLEKETTTLRPTAAGLLFVLLINRNTDYSRRLPSPQNKQQSDEISRAIALPTLAFAHGLTQHAKASERGLDLYRGWALGELARRLGEGLHRGADGIWIDPEWELAARLRLREALAGRSASGIAIDEALLQYEEIRPALSALHIAFERPSNTRRIRNELLSWADRGDAL